MLKVLVLLVCVSVVVDGKCKTNRKQCHANENCCSGCCDDGVCSQKSYCHNKKDVCKHNRCLPQETCVPYYNEGCDHCEPIAMCHIISLDQMKLKNKHRNRKQ